MINVDDVVKRANQLYNEERTKRYGVEYADGIRSDQILALAVAITEAVNADLKSLRSFLKLKMVTR